MEYSLRGGTRGLFKGGGKHSNRRIDGWLGESMVLMRNE